MDLQSIRGHLYFIGKSFLYSCYHENLYLFFIGCCPIHCDLFEIYCAPPKLGIWTWICRLNFTQRPIFSGLRDPQLKVPFGGLVLRIFTSWKNPSISVGFEPANLGSRGETLPRDHWGRLVIPILYKWIAIIRSKKRHFYSYVRVPSIDKASVRPKSRNVLLNTSPSFRKIF